VHFVVGFISEEGFELAEVEGYETNTELGLLGAANLIIGAALA